ncbi:receptor-type tyrosine-protein phosphatase C isoform X2 [Sphaeramia orbicularis]|uniref:receptor-type tyrosine-protein phosphatase C isoform X2 n=1 Tax=Sphaeramia orbicularis TaxID=375764 RepID=UPI00117F1714|nr:receptor-type tyrosine-protein phosphatase C isoform X2 [Sphaeramia orbicularis]
MAGLNGLKLLLLWAGIITVSKCQGPSGPPTSPPRTNSDHSVTVTQPVTSSPPHTGSTSVQPTDTPSAGSSPPLTPPPSSQTSALTTTSSATPSSTPTSTPTSTQNNNQNSTASTQSNITTTNPPVTGTTGSSNQTSPSCSYSLRPIGSGFNISVANFSTGSYMVSITEEQHTENTILQNITSMPYPIRHLKPCTLYKHNVTLSVNDTNTSCRSSDNPMTASTLNIEKNDTEIGNDTPKHVSYKTDWNISCEMINASNKNVKPCGNDKTCCIELEPDDICTTLKTTFTSNCPPLVKSEYLSAEKFLHQDYIMAKPNGRLPANIRTDFPKNCQNLTSDYTCVESGSNQTISLHELKPFTDYICTGDVKENGTSITKTKPVDVNIKCDLRITIKVPSRKNTSISLSWTTESPNCGSELSNLTKLSYVCEYNQTKDHYEKCRGNAEFSPERGSCECTDLEPFTAYIFKVRAKYDGKPVHSEFSKKITTKAGIPDPFDPKITIQDHNIIHVDCKKTIKFRGHVKKYVARLLYGDKEERSRVQGNCVFEFRDLSYLTSYTLELIAHNEDNPSKLTRITVTTEYNYKAVIGFLVVLILLTSVALLLVLYKIYILKRRKSHDLSESMMLISTTNDEEKLLTVEPIAAEVLLDAYKRKLADEGRLFLAEFQSIPRVFSRYTVKEAKKPCNALKNRYVDILPYDYNRVQLATGTGVPGCDYINASYIDGYKESKKYIAAQGPKEETVSHFWRMVWEQQSSIIVMVTRCEEGNRPKCAQYWPTPDREAEIYEEFVVKLNSEDQCPDYTIRHLSLTNKKEKNSEREVTHIQFMSWPDHGVPGEPQLLLKLRRRVNAFKNFFSGPIVVHCSAGVGRTGTYIGIDAMMEGLEAEGRVDIYGYVVRLRRQRCLMVQVEAQYILIHQALLEHNQFGETEIILPELHSTMTTLKQKNADSEPSLMEEEFERLPNYKTWRTYNSGITEENKKKNRCSSIIPYDYNRVLLKLDEEHSRASDPDDDEEEESSDEEDEESTKYINASHIDGYWGPRTFIAAQTPLADTVADFWLMVYQKKASAVVMLSECSDDDKDSVYWDSEKKVFGDIEVEVSNTETSPAFISRTMLIRHVKRKEVRSVKHIQFLKWGNGDLPERPQDLTDMMKDARSKCSSGKSHKGSPIVVHCNDGSTRSGMVCALWNLLDSADTEKLVDVFQVSKTLRKERQGMIPTMDQYQFLYDALEAVFPVQNGEVKAAQASASASVQIVNETKAAEQTAEGEPEQAASTTGASQEGEAESSAVADEGDKKEEPEKGSGGPPETAALEDTSNGPIVTVEV